MVCYKDPAANDPVAPTYLWRGPQNNRPENAMIGVMYVGDNDAVGFNYVVSNAADPSVRIGEMYRATRGVKSVVEKLRRRAAARAEVP